MLFTDAYQPWDPAAIDDVGWTDRMYYRHPHGTEWSAVDDDGVIHLFVVRDGILQDWHGQGGVWSGPVELGDHVARVTALRDENGEIQVAVRTTDDRVATRPAGAGDWTDLGTHNPGAGARHFGTPVLASNADGRLQVFAVNAGGGLSSRWQTGNGDWVDWEDFEGTDLLDPCNALLDSSGRIEVIAATRTGLTLWRQTVPNGAIVRGPIPGLRRPVLPPLRSTPTAGPRCTTGKRARQTSPRAGRTPTSPGAPVPASAGTVGSDQRRPPPSQGGSPPPSATAVAACPWRCRPARTPDTEPGGTWAGTSSTPRRPPRRRTAGSSSQRSTPTDRCAIAPDPPAGCGRRG